jgi:hypothetical protein
MRKEVVVWQVQSSNYFLLRTRVRGGRTRVWYTTQEVECYLTQTGVTVVQVSPTRVHICKAHGHGHWDTDGTVRGSIADRSKKFLSSESPDRIWGPPSVLFSGYQGSDGRGVKLTTSIWYRD